MSNNKLRLMNLIKILTKQSDRKHPLSELDLKELLSRENIEIRNRKTIYEDIAVLNESGYDIIYDTKAKGYYLEEAPFSLAELKILIDQIDAIKDFDATALKKKLLSFISYNEEAQLITNKRKKIKNTKVKYIDRIDLILNAIRDYSYLKIEYNNSLSEIKPYYLDYSNGNYYLYFLFDDNNNSYVYRLDRIKDLKLLDKHFEYDDQTREKILKRIKTSYDNFDKNKPEIIALKCLDYQKLQNRLEDDFPEHYLDNKGRIIVEYRPNEIFFAKIFSYQKALSIIEPKAIKKAYIEMLKEVLETNQD